MTENIQVPLKKAVTEEENVEFLKKIKVPYYSVVEQLKKTTAQILPFSTFALRRTPSCVE